MYSIVDVETSGFGPKGNKITEIAIYIFYGKIIIDEYHSLVNPECSIPYQITRITGITDETVANAPKFYEIAKYVLSFAQFKPAKMNASIII
ncbi:MAG: 3'-5' exonuclease [Flavobacteriales bacterium]|nr:3'-5' exonuclease [Flavobacteriales bacterium]